MSVTTPSRSALEFVRIAIREMQAYALESRTGSDKLDQNESPFDFPDDLKREVVSRVEARPWNRYPDFELARLRTAIAGAHGLQTENILVGNGSNELLLAAIGTFAGAGATVLYPSPTFPLYEKLVHIFGGTPVGVPLDPSTGLLPVDRMLELASESGNPPIFVVCSPNNPTGGVLAPGDLERLLESGGLVLLDRAYGEFSSSPVPPMHDRLVVLSTFSKAMGLAGLRIGLLASTGEICREIRKVKLPYSLNIFSEEAAIVALEQQERLARHIATIVGERERVRAYLLSLSGIEPFPSEANFIAFRVDGSSSKIFERLALNGILVRDVGRYPLLENVLRVSIGTPAQNDRFLECLEESLKVRQA